MNLTYKAIDAQGVPVSDVIEAVDASEAIEKLRQRGLFVKSIGSADAVRTESGGRTSKEAALSLGRLVFFTRQLAILLKSGAAVVPALQVIRKQTAQKTELAIITSLINDLEDGLPMAEAMRRFPRTFDAAYRAIVAAGEASATLPAMMDRLSGILQQRRALRGKIISATIYPALLLFMSINVVAGMLTFVVPRFAGMFKAIGVEIPWSTQALLSLSDKLTAYWYLPVGALMALTVLCVFVGLSPRGRQFLVDLPTELPGIRRIASRLIQGKIYRTLGTLIECRVGLIEALNLSRDVTANRRFRTLVHDMIEALTKGEGLSSVLLKRPFIDPAIAYSIQVGEENGQLGPSISYCADILDEENAQRIAVMTKLLEPIILIVMGGVVGGVAISLFLPLFDVTSAMH